MKEEEPSWFARWEEELPSPEELMPLSQTLITPDLALAFDITSHNPNSSDNDFHHNGGSHAQGGLPFALVQSPSQSQHHQGPPSSHQNQQGGGGDYDSSEMGGGGGGGGPGGDDQARTLKRPRLVWTPQLHKRFVDAVAHLGIKNAVPKTIMQLMSVDGLTRENVASHLQKYRLYLKRMQGLSSGAAGHGSAGGPGVPHADPATEQLFASGPVPHPYIGRGPPAVGPGGGAGGGGPEQFMPYVPVASLQQHHHQQMAAAAHHHQQQQRQQQYFHHRHMGHLGLPPGGGFDHGFLARQQHHHQVAAGIHGHRIMGPGGMGMVAPPVASQYAEEFEAGAGAGGGGRTMLTLFPTNDD